MIFPETIFVGIDPTSSQKSFTYAVLDKGLNLMALADAELDDVLVFLAQHSAVMIAVNAPSGLNRKLTRDGKKETSKLRVNRAASFRQAEVELRERGITVAGTPSTIGACPAWMQNGFALYRQLEKMGFRNFPTDGQPYQVMETHPHACYSVIGGSLPLPKPSIEGKLQRQLLLYECGLRIKDPMYFFEEITRHKMIKGTWPVELLYQSEQLDALVAAYTAWVSIHKPDQISFLGSEQEGRIVLPVKDIKERY